MTGMISQVSQQVREINAAEWTLKNMAKKWGEDAKLEKRKKMVRNSRNGKRQRRDDRYQPIV
jgi:hypothetical protein